MEGPRCVILNCFAIKYGSRHRFPNPAKDMNMFKKWIKFSDKNIQNLSPEQIYKNRRVCSNHFKCEQFGPNNRLLRTAYPILNVQNTMVKCMLCKRYKPFNDKVKSLY